MICGDGVLSETEECDDGNILVECPYGEGACEVCSDCTMVTGLIQFCGDNQLQEDEEECDNGMIGNSNEAADACRTNCKLPSCGDGVTDTNEVCDDETASTSAALLPVWSKTGGIVQDYLCLFAVIISSWATNNATMEISRLNTVSMPPPIASFVTTNVCSGTSTILWRWNHASG